MRNLQSSMRSCLVQNSFAYPRTDAANTAKTRHRVRTVYASGLLLGGLSKLGIIPGGGSSEGPSRIFSCWSGGRYVIWSSDMIANIG